MTVIINYKDRNNKQKAEIIFNANGVIQSDAGFLVTHDDTESRFINITSFAIIEERCNK